MKWLRHRCEKRGHDWFPNLPQSEFLPSTSSCLRCHEKKFVPPWGDCVGVPGGHPLEDHYVWNGQDYKTVKAEVGFLSKPQILTCAGPR